MKVVWLIDTTITPEILVWSIARKRKFGKWMRVDFPEKGRKKPLRYSSLCPCSSSIAGDQSALA